MAWEPGRGAAFFAAALLAAGCSASGASLETERALPRAEPTTTSAPTTTTTTTSTTTTVPTTTTTAPTTTTTSAIPRVVVDTGFAPYATANPLVLHHPAAGVERVGFHESGHDGALMQEPAATAARALVLDSRSRGTGERTAADIVVVPETEIRSPVTGTVIRGGEYVLYCDDVDEYLVIEPDARPGWEVKVLHVVGLQVGVGARVEAGVTPIARYARQLPFSSQVDDQTADPAWPHVHIEVVDPSIPDRPSGPGCTP